MQYLTQEGKVIYKARDKKTSKVFPAMEWLAAMCSHIPNRGEQTVRYYGFCNTVRDYSSSNHHFNPKPKMINL